MKHLPVSIISSISYFLDTLHLVIQDSNHSLGYIVQMVRCAGRIKALITIFKEMPEVRNIGVMIEDKHRNAKKSEVLVFNIQGNFGIDLLNNLDSVLLKLMEWTIWTNPKKLVLVMLWKMLSFFAKSTVLLRSRKPIGDRDDPRYLAFEKEGKDMFILGTTYLPSLFVEYIFSFAFVEVTHVGHFHMSFSPAFPHSAHVRPCI